MTVPSIKRIGNGSLCQLVHTGPCEAVMPLPNYF